MMVFCKYNTTMIELEIVYQLTDKVLIWWFRAILSYLTIMTSTGLGASVSVV
jgi:hypothetical protein